MSGKTIRLFVFSFASLSTCQLVNPAPALAAPPKLSVVIVVDQLPQNYLERFRPYLKEGGFEAFLSSGASFVNCRYDHAVTYTCVGHSMIGSGLHPDQSGIISNDWHDRTRKKTLYCAEDAQVRPSTPTATSDCCSPKNFLGVSVSQRVKSAYPEARVIGLSLKDRSAIMTVGPGADAAYWFDEKAKQFVSSDYYRYSQKVLQFNEGLSSWVAQNARWELSQILSSTSAFSQACPLDDPEKNFPHETQSVKSLLKSPQGNELLEKFAEHVIVQEDLGKNPKAPDVLFVSFSATDYIGHSYGPDSCEAADGMIRLDAALNRFFQFLLSRLKKEELLVILSSDHGVAPVPETAQKQGKDAGRVGSEAKEKIDAMARAQFGLKEGEEILETMGPDHFMKNLPFVYLNRELIRKKNIPLETVKVFLKQAFKRIPGVNEVYTDGEIISGQSPGSVRLSFHPERSGDLFVLLKPYYIWSYPGLGTSHGTPYDYDTHVPLLLWGGKIAPGTYEDPVSPAWIAPTLLKLLEIKESPFRDSRPLPYITPN